MSSTEPEFVSESSDEQARRRARERRNEREALARDILENDPDVTTIAEARVRADEVLELRREVEKGLRNPETGELTREGRRRQRSQRRSTRTRGGGSSRSGGRVRRLARKSARAVVAPYESAASAGWTFAMGGISLVLLYVVLRDAGAISALLNGLRSGLRAFTDPYRPLLPDANEAAAPGAQIIELTRGAQQVVTQNPVDPWAQAARRSQ